MVDSLKLKANVLLLPDLSDSEVATRLSEAILIPRVGNVTYVVLGNVWGLERAAAFKAGIKQLINGKDLDLAAMADFANVVLQGDGFTPGNLEAAKAAERHSERTISSYTQPRRSMMDSGIGVAGSGTEVP
jgi:hypothetical protein